MRPVYLFICAGAVAALSSSALATIHELRDRNSVVQVNDASQAGMSGWQVDGVNHLYQQWFWFRVAGDNQERSLDTLPLLGSFATDTNPFTDSRNDTLGLLYGGNGFTIQPQYILRGGQANSNSSDIGEQITINNTGRETLHISFFQYCDFDINGSAGGDTVEIMGSLHNTARQSDGEFGMSETVVTPVPTHYQVGGFPTILNVLNDAAVSNFSDNAGPQSGDVSWGFQWDLTIAPGSSVIISKDKGIIPTPGAVALLALGGLTGLRRRR